MTSLSEAAVDAIIALQLTVAWAGEGRCQPARLGWWDTDLVDADGGGDFFARLMPRTAAWAALQAVREVALRADRSARGRAQSPDSLRTIYFLGAAVDEKVSSRIAFLKRAGRPPHEALALPVSLDAPFDRRELERALASSGVAVYSEDAIGRRLEGPLSDGPADLVQKLAAALIPFSPSYSFPYYAIAPAPIAQGRAPR
ncbi:MAG: BREX-6 system BrxE protein [Polyangiaceae bacterium]|nr:BREX-6 system BrxE protein [Polyangiaceae bacterium]